MSLFCACCSKQEQRVHAVQVYRGDMRVCVVFTIAIPKSVNEWYSMPDVHPPGHAEQALCNSWC